jgi:hypothetical protein
MKLRHGPFILSFSFLKIFHREVRMSLVPKVAEKPEEATVTCSVPKPLNQLLDQYVKFRGSRATRQDTIRVCLQYVLDNDREFQEWLASRRPTDRAKSIAVAG